MALRRTGRRDRAVFTGIVLAVLASVVPTTSGIAAPRHSSAIAGAQPNVSVSADEVGTNTYTPLSGPAIAESGAHDLALNSTTILNIPGGFRFRAGFGSASIDAIECDLGGFVTVTATQATFKVTHESTVPGCVVWFVGLEVQPTSGPGVGVGYITKTGTSDSPASGTRMGTLVKVAGAADELTYDQQPSSNNFGGLAFATQPSILARDQFSDYVPNALVTLSITPGTGPSGARLTCAQDPIRTDGGFADFQACRIDKAGTYRLRATSGHIIRDSGTFNVAVGTATRLVFRAYPAATTNALLAPQPRVAIVDAGGNIVTSYPTTHVTLGINKNAGTFTCSGGYAVAQAVRGVAQFKSCRQTTVGTGYRLTAWIGFASTGVGKAFSVTR